MAQLLCSTACIGVLGSSNAWRRGRGSRQPPFWVEELIASQHGNRPELHPSAGNPITVLAKYETMKRPAIRLQLL
jgi:hypothetical protein